MQKKPWIPPYWLVGVDPVALILLGLGLHMQYSAGSALSEALPPVLKLPLLIFGGVLFLVGAVIAARLVLIHQKH